MPMFAPEDWKKVAAKAFSEDEDAAECEEVTLESSNDEKNPWPNCDVFLRRMCRGVT